MKRRRCPHIIPMLTAVLVLGTVIGACVTVLDDQVAARDVRQDLEQLATIATVWKSIEGGRERLHATMDRLRDAPSEIVILEVVDALRHNSAFELGNARQSAYGLLRHHRAALYDDGFEQLLIGLHDPDGVPAALAALGLTPEWRYPELVDALSPLLHDKQFPEHLRGRIIDLLANTGQEASRVLPTITDIYHNDQVADATRMIAAQAMVRIGGTLWAIEHCGVIDLANAPVFQANAITWALAIAGTDSEGTFGMDPHLRAIPRAMIRSAMKHQNSEVRGAGAYALLNSFSRNERVIEIDPGQYRMHPELTDAFADMAENDPDADLRASAAQVLNEHFPLEIERRIVASQQEQD